MPEKKTRKSKKIEFTCDQCSIQAFANPSAYAKTKSHFCSKECYQASRKQQKLETVTELESMPLIDTPWPVDLPIVAPEPPKTVIQEPAREITHEEYMQYLRNKYSTKVVKEEVIVPMGSVVPIMVQTYGDSLSDIDLINHHEREVKKREIEVLKRQNQFKQAQCATNMSK